MIIKKMHIRPTDNLYLPFPPKTARREQVSCEESTPQDWLTLEWTVGKQQKVKVPPGIINTVFK